MVQNIKQVIWDNEGLETPLSLLMADNESYIILGKFWTFFIKIIIFDAFLVIARALIFDRYFAVPEIILLLIINVIVVLGYFIYMYIINTAVKEYSLAGLFVLIAALFFIILLI